jgi:hypothetical protein
MDFECFLCCGTDGPLFKLCDCNTLVHKPCFEKLIKLPTHADYCAACRKTYPLLKSTKYRILFPSMDSRFIFFLYVFLYVTLIPSITILFFESKSAAFGLCIFGLTCTIILCFVHYRACKYMCCLHVAKVVTEKKVVWPLEYKVDIEIL